MTRLDALLLTIQILSLTQLSFFWTLGWTYFVFGRGTFGPIDRPWKMFLAVFFSGPFGWLLKGLDALNIEPLETRVRNFYNRAKFW